MAGVNVGKVKTKELDKGGARTRRARDRPPVRADPEGHAGDPAPEDAARRDLRGAAPGRKSAGRSPTAARSRTRVEPTVELDEIFTAFDQPTRAGVPGVGQGAGRAITKGRRGQDLNDAFGNFAGFAADGAEAAEGARRAEGRGAPPRPEHRARVRRDQRAPRRAARPDRQLEQVFEATASRDEALAETFRDLPDLPRRVEGDAGAARGLLAQHAAARQRPQGPRRRPRSDDPRPRRPGARPRAALPRPRPADSRSPRPACRRSRDAAEAQTAVRRRCTPFLQELNPILIVPRTSTRRRSPASSPTAAPDLRPLGHGDRVQIQIGHHRRTSFSRARRRRPAGLGARQRLPAAQRAQARPVARRASRASRADRGEASRRGRADGGPEAEDKRPPCFVAPPSL